VHSLNIKQLTLKGGIMTNQLAFVFPGQGSQKVGMCDAWQETYPGAIDFFKQASVILGYDLWDIIHNGPVERLNQTIHTQPAMLAADVFLWRLYQQRNDTLPKLLAGHSLGEYAALVAADAFSFEDALKLVQQRARLMQDAVPEGQGGMGVILGLSAEQVVALCQQVHDSSHIIEAVNFNAPVQTVIAGHLKAVEEVLSLAKAAGAKRAMLLPLSIPAHCQLMKPAAEQFAKYLESTPVQSPKIPVIQNAQTAINTHPDDIRQALVLQLYSPVKWVETIQLMVNNEINTIVECGVGNVLTGLNKRINPDLQFLSVTELLQV